MGAYNKTLGTIGESVILAEFLKHGINVLIPYGDNLPYDLVICINNIFYKIQVKTTEQVVDDCMVFNICKSNPYTKKNVKYTKEEVDYFALYCVETNWCGLISINECGVKELRIKTQPPKNNQLDKSKLADDYILNKQIIKTFGLDYIKNNIVKKVYKKTKKVVKTKICPVCKKQKISIKSGMCRTCYEYLRKERSNINEKTSNEKIYS